MDALTILGLVAVTAMLVFYGLEDRSPHYVLAEARRIAVNIAKLPEPLRQQTKQPNTS